MKPMLAGKFDATKVVKKLEEGPLLGQLKYDGIRVFIRDGVAWTRSIKPVRSAEFQSWVAWNKDDLEGLDGEIICGDPTAQGCFQRTSSFAMSYDKSDDFTFYAFDKWDHPDVFADRFTIVEEICGHGTMGPYDQPKLAIAETRELNTMEEIMEFHDDMISQGQEGIILRDPNSYYKFGRGSPIKCECIKMKEGGWVDTECRILGFHEQLHNANEAMIDNLGYTERSGHKENLIGKGTLGSISIAGRFEDGREFTCRVGTGLDDEIRAKVWAYKQTYSNKIVKIKYFNVGIKDKPRFPTFLGFRDPDDMDQEQMELLI
jgi:DNA ligase-1